MEYPNRTFTPDVTDDVYVNVNTSNGDKIKPESNSTPEETQLRRKLKFFFANPCQRLRMHDTTLYEKIPIKLIIQLMKIVFVTSQLLIVGQERSRFANYLDRSNIALKRLFLKSWITQYETMPYPPASGVYGLYHIEDLYDHINFAVNQFREVPHTALGSFYFVQRNGKDMPMELCITYYDTIEFYPNETLVLDPNEFTDLSCSKSYFHFPAVNRGQQVILANGRDCFSTNYNSTDQGTTRIRFSNHTSFDNGTNPDINNDTEELIMINSSTTYDVREHFILENVTHAMDRLLEIKLNFLLTSIRLDATIQNSRPDCFTHNGEIIFDNTDRNGQLLVDLKVTLSEFPCKGSFPVAEEKYSRDIGLAVTVIMLNLSSLFFCCGAIINAMRLMKDTKLYFNNQLQKPLSFTDQLRFIKHWDMLTIANDILTVSGISLRLVVEQNRNSNLSSRYDTATTLLGLGCLLVWVGILRYFAFFPKFYMLFLTINKALHNILRYMLCVCFIYAGFVFCGWAVLGPYHLKFKSLQSTAEVLFATMTGDELFVTFSGFTVAKDDFIWWFSRVYMYVYIALFTAIAINVFIAILTDTYETIKNYCKHGFPTTELLRFIHHDEIYSPLPETFDIKSICCCSKNIEEDNTYDD